MNADTLSILFDNTDGNSLKRESVSSSIANMIVDYITAKKLKPGDQLPTEQEFMTHLGVGRNSVREAVKMLSFLGVVEIRKGIGSYITDSISSSALNPLVLSLAFEQGLSMDLLELRILIDSGVGAIVIDKADEDGIALLEKTNEQIGESIRNLDQDTIPLKELDFAFHQAMFRIAGNSLVEKIGMAVYKLFNFAMEKSMVADPEQAYQNHKLIIEAIKERNKAKLIENTRKSLAVWSKFV
ncbi:FadR/GntR family transcriptional regulator [Pleomorphochaeta sp. DL1XJH-081]|uniref:FadR/GntR family transcriptional regulator n=1 Tax=Pleomorphochaeta sp. DL1XJH-081 TaxID=3409690 RepID=UPI003BB6A272